MSTAPTGHAALSDRAFLALVVVGGLLGIPAALLAALFLAAVNLLQKFLWHQLPQMIGMTSAPWYFVLGLPVVGALIVLFAAPCCLVTAATGR